MKNGLTNPTLTTHYQLVVINFGGTSKFMVWKTIIENFLDVAAG